MGPWWRATVVWLGAWLLVAGCQPVPIPIDVADTAAPVTETAEPSLLAQVTETASPTASPKPSATATLPPVASFQTPHPILGDVRVRQALAHCTDRNALVQALYPWFTTPELLVMDSFIGPEHPYYAGDALARYPYDPARGQALLDEAGWTLAPAGEQRTNALGQPLTLTLSTTDASFRQTLATAWQAQLRTCGVDLVLNHQPATWLFGDESGLARREFELAAFSWTGPFEAPSLALYACDRIPSEANGWRGQNFAGWCNPEADEAVRTARRTLDPLIQQEAFDVVQGEFTRDLPSLPLFRRPQLLAANPALEGFAPDASQLVYTWDAERWRIPGRDTLFLGLTAEPSSFQDYSFVGFVLNTLTSGVDYVRLGGVDRPVLLARLPSLENGAAILRTVEVGDSTLVVEAAGGVVALQPGVAVYDAAGAEVEFASGTLSLPQWQVTYEYVDGLTWSDGTPVTRDDYEAGYNGTCLNGLGWTPPAACQFIAAVDFSSDTAYTVTWLPGYQGPDVLRPPFSRLPAHLPIAGGRTLAEVPVADWLELDELRAPAISAGPYVVREWEYGRRLVFTANPYFVGGPPATPRIEVRLIEAGQIVSALASGEVDVVGWDGLSPEQAPELLALEAQGLARVIVQPAGTWEHIDFALWAK